MPQYVLLMTLASEGREAMVHDPRNIVKAANQSHVEGVEWLGLRRPRALRLRKHR